MYKVSVAVLKRGRQTRSWAASASPGRDTLFYLARAWSRLSGKPCSTGLVVITTHLRDAPAWQTRNLQHPSFKSLSQSFPRVSVVSGMSKPAIWVARNCTLGYKTPTLSSDKHPWWSRPDGKGHLLRDLTSIRITLQLLRGVCSGGSRRSCHCCRHLSCLKRHRAGPGLLSFIGGVSYRGFSSLMRGDQPLHISNPGPDPSLWSDLLERKSNG